MANNPNIMDNVTPYQYKKGQSGNPAGGSAKSRRKKAERLLAEQQFDELFGKGASRKLKLIKNDDDLAWLQKLYSADAGTLAEIAKWQGSPASVKSYAIAMLRDMQNGKTYTIDKIRERLFGKPTQYVELTGAGGKDLMMQQEVNLFGLIGRMSDDELKAEIDRLDKLG